MKKLDVFIVRFLPFVLFIVLGANILCTWHGIEEITLGYHLHGNSAIYALGFFLVSLANKRYHCVWNRAMYAYLIFTPVLNFLDACFDFVPAVDTYLYIIWSTYLLTAIITAYLAIRHFVIVTKRKLDHELRTINQLQRQPVGHRKIRRGTLQAHHRGRKRRKM